MKKIFGFDYWHDGGPFRSIIEAFQESPTLLIVRMTDATDANRLAGCAPWELAHLFGIKVGLSWVDDRWYQVAIESKVEQVSEVVAWLEGNYAKNKCSDGGA